MRIACNVRVALSVGRMALAATATASGVPLGVRVLPGCPPAERFEKELDARMNEADWRDHAKTVLDVVVVSEEAGLAGRLVVRPRQAVHRGASAMRAVRR